MLLRRPKGEGWRRAVSMREAEEEEERERETLKQQERCTAPLPVSGLGFEA